MTNKQLPTPGAHVVWPAAAAGQPSPPAKGRGLARLRAQPGAEGVRQQVVAEQQAARAEAQAAHVPLHRVQPVKPGMRVQVGGVHGSIKLTHVRNGVSNEWGHVVHFGGNDMLWVPDALVVVT